MKTKISVSCAFAECGKQFEKCASECRRSQRLGRKHYCSMACYGKNAGVQNIPPEKACNPQNLLKGGWQQDDLSPFRVIFKTAKMHTRRRKQHRDFSITLADLLEQWKSQAGVCPLTGWKLVLPKNSADKVEFTPDRASLDRIDSSKGYVRGNVRFVALMAQYAKNGWSDKDVLEFAKAVVSTELR